MSRARTMRRASIIWGVVLVLSVLGCTTLIAWADTLHGPLSGLVAGGGFLCLGLFVVSAAGTIGGGFGR